MGALDDADLGRKLGTWLAEQLDVDEVVIANLSTPTVGQSNDTVLFDASWQQGGSEQREELVLRRQPMARQLFLDADVLREAAVVDALASSDVPVPRIRFSEADPRILGAPFFVMGRIHGTVPAAKPSIHAVGWLPTLSVTERRRLWESALSAFVAVHAVDWTSTHRFLSEGHDLSMAGYVAELEQWYSWSTQGQSYPTTDAALAYLKANIPDDADDELVLVWGDPRVGNILFADDLSVAACLDWENARIGSPKSDLAHWLFFDNFATDASGVPRLEGFPDRAATIKRYEELSGRQIGDLFYYDVMETFWIAVTLIRQADISVENGTLPPGTDMGRGNVVTQLLARLLDLEVPALSADYLAHRRPVEESPTNS